MHPPPPTLLWVVFWDRICQFLWQSVCVAVVKPHDLNTVSLTVCSNTTWWQCAESLVEIKVGSDTVNPWNNLIVATKTDKDKITGNVFIVTDFEIIYGVLSEKFYAGNNTVAWCLWVGNRVELCEYAAIFSTEVEIQNRWEATDRTTVHMRIAGNLAKNRTGHHPNMCSVQRQLRNDRLGIF
jgi:hypothetical protein